MIAMRRGRVWWSRGLGVALLVPFLLWLGGCWLFNMAPTAVFTVSVPVVEVGGTIDFSAIRSEDEDGVIVSYEWDFGDGTDGTGRAVSHTYAQIGAFTVVLRVTDDGGETGTTQRILYVEAGEPPGPAASFTASPSSGGSPLSVWFDASATTYGTGPGPLMFSWDFGDGSTGYGKTTSHLYVTSYGRTYTATLTVTGPDSKTGTATATISVAGPGGTPAPSGSPSARFDITFPDTNDDVAPVRARLDPEDSEADTGRVLATYTWSFGDGNAANSITADVQTHTFITDSASEIFSVTLVVIDDHGANGSITKTVRAKNYQPVAGFEILDMVEQSNSSVLDPEVDPDDVFAGLTDADWEADDVQITGLGAGNYRAWIRSQDLDEHEDTDWEWDRDSDNPVPNASSAKPAGYDDNNFSFDPEGQTWAPTAAGPDWFPNRAWGIRRLWVDWDDGNIDIVDFVDGDDTTASHVYAFPGTVSTYTITVTAEDWFGAQDLFQRDLILSP